MRRRGGKALGRVPSGRYLRVVNVIHSRWQSLSYVHVWVDARYAKQARPRPGRRPPRRPRRPPRPARVDSRLKHVKTYLVPLSRVVPSPLHCLNSPRNPSLLCTCSRTHTHSAYTRAHKRKLFLTWRKKSYCSRLQSTRMYRVTSVKLYISFVCTCHKNNNNFIIVRCTFY